MRSIPYKNQIYANLYYQQLKKTTKFFKQYSQIGKYFIWYTILLQASPDGSFVSTGACNLGVPGSNPGRAEYLSSWLCIYSAPNCSKVWSVQCCLWYCALQRTLAVIRNSPGHSPGFGIPSVAILP